MRAIACHTEQAYKDLLCCYFLPIPAICHKASCCPLLPIPVVSTACSCLPVKGPLWLPPPLAPLQAGLQLYLKGVSFSSCQLGIKITTAGQVGRIISVEKP